MVRNERLNIIHIGAREKGTEKVRFSLFQCPLRKVVSLNDLSLSEKDIDNRLITYYHSCKRLRKRLPKWMTKE